ncbi:hypothetical protein PSTG_04489 [Puccinia striiformis f. sp. tritici PST-78]|uniref:Uncharacterized protein n=1 Tax=Puccinia striiformis f. sp. tritici PST-78 TaxID=1165861 RepID=A0A0L0VSN1_9BASI|nr:hypothetical protein PSTG_04489 [Puccinia striiformis f. sp. tritici PST-78]
MNPADSYQLGDHLTIDQVDQWLKEATESRRSLSSSPTSDLEVDIVDIVGSHSTSTTGSVKRRAVDQRSHQKSRPLVGSTAGAPTPANTGTQDEQASDPNEDKIKISLEYKLHVPKKNKKPASTRNSNKRKATTTASAQNYTKNLGDDVRRLEVNNRRFQMVSDGERWDQEYTITATERDTEDRRGEASDEEETEIGREGGMATIENGGNCPSTPLLSFKNDPRPEAHPLRRGGTLRFISEDGRFSLEQQNYKE